MAEEREAEMDSGHRRPEIQRAQVEEILVSLNLRERPELYLGSRDAGLLAVFLSGVFAAQEADLDRRNRERMRSFGLGLASRLAQPSGMSWWRLCADAAAAAQSDELDVFWHYWDEHVALDG